MKFETYPFEKLNLLLKDVKTPDDKPLVSLTIGEPQFETPEFIQQALCESSNLLKKYPKTAGEDYLQDAQIGFIKRRFGVELYPSEILPTFGTREVLFNFPQFFLANKENPVMAFVNPFYQIYEGAAIASNAKIIHLDLLEENGFKPVIEKETLKECDLVILNSPCNPCASAMNLDELREWARLAVEFDFVLINDECYSEIYTSTPPPSLLEAALLEGNKEFKNILVMNSISKRSSAPGLRSGLIAGDSKILKPYLQYRTYIGCASPLPLQVAAAKAWNDDLHVEKARDIYIENFKIAHEILGVKIPEATFYLWLDVGDGISFAKELFEKTHIKVLPGAYLGRHGMGSAYVRLALVEKPEVVKEALKELSEFLKGWN